MNGLEWPRAGSGTLLKFCRGDNIVVQLSIVAADSLSHDSLLGVAMAGRRRWITANSCRFRTQNNIIIKHFYHRHFAFSGAEISHELAPPYST